MSVFVTVFKKVSQRGQGSHRPHGTIAGSNLVSTSYPDHGRYADLSLKGKIPTAEPAIEPET
jgi:hypothetical protein